MTILDPCMSLEWIKKNLCVGSCGYVPASVNTFETCHETTIEQARHHIFFRLRLHVVQSENRNLIHHSSRLP